MTKYNLEIAAFLVGFSIMALELTATRVFAPYFGTSIYVWTSIIGIVLGALSAGYYFGGKFADIKPKEKTLSLVIVSAAIYILIIALIKDMFLINSFFLMGGARLSSFAASMLLLAPPSFLLGMVSPYIVRLRLKDVNEGGRVSGRLYSVSTIGSIVGTFAVGFFLFEYFGNTIILILISLTLATSVVFVNLKKNFFRYLILPLFIVFSVPIVSSFNSILYFNNLIDIDTKYNRVWVYESVDFETNKKIKIMKIDPYFIQSAMFLDSDELVSDYAKIFSTDEKVKPEIKKGLILGGAAYSYPKKFLEKFPDAKLDVVEIDPGLTQIAKDHFNLKETKNLTIYHEDARTFLNKHDDKYDVIYMDVFSSAGSAPFHLTTKEAVKKVGNLLDENGVVYVNMVASLNGDSSLFYKSLAKTYGTEFKHVYYIASEPDDPEKIQNIMLVLFTNPENLNLNEIGYELKKFNSNEGIILTDNFAPIESMMTPVIDKLKS